MKHRNRFPKTRTATGLKPTPCKARNPSLAVLKLSSIYSRQVRPSIRQMESLRLRKLQTAQDSCQRLAKHKPEKLPNVTFGIHKKQVYNSPTSEETLPGTLVWNRSEIISKLGLAKRVRKPQTAAGSCQRLATHMPEKLPNVSFGIHKKQVYSFGIHKKQVYNPPTSQETLRLQPATVVCNRYEIISKSGLGKRFRKPQTAAGFVPKACKTQANKTLETSPTEPTKKKEKERKKIASRPSDIARNNSTIARHARLEALRKQLEIWPWKTVPKASNSSRIRAQGMQNTSQ